MTTRGPADGAEADAAYAGEWVLDAPLPRVWRALTTPALATEWLGASGLLPTVGARFGVEPGDGRAPIACEVLDVEAPRRMRLAWREHGPAGPVDSVVTVTLEAVGADRTRLSLVHALPAARAVTLMAGSGALRRRPRGPVAVRPRAHATRLAA